MDEEFSLPQPFTGGSTALALPAPSVGSGLESMSSMSPMESMMEIFMEIRDGINTLVDLFQAQILGSADESRDLELAAADTDDTDPGCAARATQGETLNMRIVVDGGGETLTELKIDSLTLGTSIM